MRVESSSGSSSEVDDTVSSPIAAVVLPLPLVPCSEMSSGNESTSGGLYVDISSSEYGADQSSGVYSPSGSFKRNVSQGPFGDWVWEETRGALVEWEES